MVERTNSWHNRGFKKLLVCPELRARVVEAFVALANAIIIIRRLIRQAWATPAGTPGWPDDPGLYPRDLIANELKTQNTTFERIKALSFLSISLCLPSFEGNEKRKIEEEK